MKRGLVHHSVQDEQLDGQHITLRGQEMVNYGSCSYLGLEHHEALKAGVVDAVGRFGTQYSSSRTFVSLSMYDELESKLEQIFEKPVIVSASTTLGHLATLPTLVGENDAVVLDLQVHSSIQMTVQQLKAAGVTIDIIRHNDMDALEQKIRHLKADHDKVWYLADGIYSMFGDAAPLARLEALLNKYEQFHLYIDDAHGMGWTGKHGCGYVRSRMAHHDRMILAVSLNKSFAAAGGAIVFPNEAWAKKVRQCGGTLIFSGPIQPPMLGAALASADLHLSDDILPIQNKVQELIDYTNAKIKELGLPQYQETDSPLFLIPMGLPRVVFNMIDKLHKDGFYVNGATFPATPIKQGGIRFMVNANLEKEQMGAMLECLHGHYNQVLAEEDMTCKEIAAYFGIPEFEVNSPEPVMAKAAAASGPLKVEIKRSIKEMNAEEWNGWFSRTGNITTGSLESLERVFTGFPAGDQQADFYYLTVREASGKAVLATFFTCSRMKDDMFAPGEVSEQIESIRKDDPHYLTSKVVMLGAPISKGQHLYCDFEHAEWKQALKMMVKEMEQVMTAQEASTLMVREFIGEVDERLRNAFLELGLAETQLPDVSILDGINWTNNDEYMAGLSSRRRYDVRREVLRKMDQFRVDFSKPTTRKELDECYDLYKNVFDRSFDMNVHELPRQFFDEIAQNEDYDFIRLYLADAEEGDAPIGVMFSYAGSHEYAALIVGLDYEYVRSHNTYKVMLYLTTQRAAELGCERLDLAFTALDVKKKFGARPQPARAYVQVLDHFNMAVIDAMSRKIKRARVA